MSKIDPAILDQFRTELRQIGYKYINNLLEWNHVTFILENEILPIINKAVLARFEVLEQENKQLKARFNQLSFSNDPGRDRRMIELFKLGYSRGRIAKEVRMSKWGVSKALRRLGVN
ncbi:MAG: hypothetical protein CL946_06945 [Ectothiorhodospiraceae bacterium]|nr:hypothetical protein [Ectothiorhodospiraceae bacterium]